MMENLTELLDRGGFIMIPLLFCSLIGVAIVLERAFSLRHKRVVKPELQEAIAAAGSRAGVDRALDACSSHPGPFANIIRVGLQSRALPSGVLREIVTDHGRREMRALGRGLGVLETIAAIAPLLGLLGTVLGMIKVFAVISQQGIGRAAALSAGISEALLTTAVGLSIGILALIAYNYFTDRTQAFAADIEAHSTALLQQLAPDDTP